MSFSSSSMSEDAPREPPDARENAPQNRLNDALLRGFPPAGAVDPGDEPLFLILGSFPSVQSLERKEYYGNPRNHFWIILSSCFGLPEPRSYAEKLEFLKRCRIALWDVFALCERPGSLDRDIVRAVPNPVASLLERFPTIRNIGANGAASTTGFLKEFVRERGGLLARTGESLVWSPSTCPGRSIRLVRLPSTSPVPTSEFKTARDKIPLWRDFFTIQM